MQEFNVRLHTENSDTVLSRVIETIKRRRIPIREMYAKVSLDDSTRGTIELKLIAGTEAKRLLKTQLEKLMDVIEIRG